MQPQRPTTRLQVEILAALRREKRPMTCGELAARLWPAQQDRQAPRRHDPRAGPMANRLTTKGAQGEPDE